MSDAPAGTAAFADLGRPEPFVRSLVGVAVMLGLIAVAEPLLFGLGYYRTLSLHPFWIVVLLAASQHGLAVGLATVAMATVLLGMPVRPLGVDATVHFAQAAVLPLQWLTVALILGMYRQRQLQATEALWQANQRLSQMNDTLAQEVDRMDTMLVVVERSAAARAAETPAAAPEMVDAAPELVPLPPPVAGADFDTHRLLAELASAGTADFPGALTRAAHAVMDMPTMLVLRIPGEDTLFIGAPDAMTFDDVFADRLFARLDGFWDKALIEKADLCLDGAGFVLVRAQTRADGHDLKFAVLAFSEGDSATASEDLACRLDVLAAMARIWVDRFGEELASHTADAQPMVADA